MNFLEKKKAEYEITHEWLENGELEFKISNRLKKYFRLFIKLPNNYPFH